MAVLAQVIQRNFLLKVRRMGEEQTQGEEGWGEVRRGEKTEEKGIHYVWYVLHLTCVCRVYGFGSVLCPTRHCIYLFKAWSELTLLGIYPFHTLAFKRCVSRLTIGFNIHADLLSRAKAFIKRETHTSASMHVTGVGTCAQVGSVRSAWQPFLSNCMPRAAGVLLLYQWVHDQLIDVRSTATEMTYVKYDVLC